MVQLEHELLQLPVGTRTPSLERTPGLRAAQEEHQISVCSQSWLVLGSPSVTLRSVILLFCCFPNGGHPFTHHGHHTALCYFCFILPQPTFYCTVCSVCCSYLLNSAEPNLMSHSQTLSRHVKRTFTVLESLYFVCQGRGHVLYHIQCTWH